MENIQILEKKRPKVAIKGSQDSERISMLLDRYEERGSDSYEEVMGGHTYQMGGDGWVSPPSDRGDSSSHTHSHTHSYSHYMTPAFKGPSTFRDNMIPVFMGGQRKGEQEILKLNEEAMQRLKDGKEGASHQILERCHALLLQAQHKLKEQVLPESPTALRLLSVTYNNLGCLYRRKMQLGTALKYLHQSLAIDQKLDSDPVAIANTRINICAILSKIGRHGQALEQAE